MKGWAPAPPHQDPPIVRPCQLDTDSGPHSSTCARTFKSLATDGHFSEFSSWSSCLHFWPTSIHLKQGLALRDKISPLFFFTLGRVRNLSLQTMEVTWFHLRGEADTFLPLPSIFALSPPSFHPIHERRRVFFHRAKTFFLLHLELSGPRACLGSSDGAL